MDFPSFPKNIEKRLPILFFSALILGVISLCGYFFLMLKMNSNYVQATTDITETTVVLTERGYEPAHIEIRRGTRVVFKTTRKQEYWPASNTHPWHRIYPTFDPKEPVQPSESWTFTFDQIGTWGYHDHLRPFFTGTVKVVD
jgi:plastocyanin domain-containing protein